MKKIWIPSIILQQYPSKNNLIKTAEFTKKKVFEQLTLAVASLVCRQTISVDSWVRPKRQALLSCLSGRILGSTLFVSPEMLLLTWVDQKPSF